MHNAMRKIPELEAQADLDRLLDDVEKGESVLITRNGRTIARIVPELQKAGALSTTLTGTPQDLKPSKLGCSIPELEPAASSYGLTASFGGSATYSSPVLASKIARLSVNNFNRSVTSINSCLCSAVNTVAPALASGVVFSLFSSSSRA